MAQTEAWEKPDFPALTKGRTFFTETGSCQRRHSRLKAGDAVKSPPTDRVLAERMLPHRQVRPHSLGTTESVNRRVCRSRRQAPVCALGTGVLGFLWEKTTKAWGELARS